MGVIHLYFGFVAGLILGSVNAIRFSVPQKITNDERLVRLNESCTKTGVKWQTNQEKRIALGHILVNDKHQVLYCYVPKVACSNWKRVFMVLDGEANDTSSIDEVNHKTGFKSLLTYSPAEIRDRLDNYYKFMFVREPLKRLVSAYKDKMTGYNSYYSRTEVTGVIRKIRGMSRNEEAPDGGVTLNEFLRYILASHPATMDEHWMPMNHLCQPCSISYDYVGMLENVDDDSEEVLEDMDLRQLVAFPRKQKMYSTGNQSPTTEELLDRIPRPLLMAVLLKYHLDYELFSYEVPQL